MRKCRLYLVALVWGGGIAWLLLSVQGFGEIRDQMRRVCLLSDAMTVPGVLLFMAGLLRLAADWGAFDGISYALQYARKRLLPFGNAGDVPPYGDFILQRRDSRPRKRTPLLVAGSLYLSAGMILAAMYSRM